MKKVWNFTGKLILQLIQFGVSVATCAAVIWLFGDDVTLENITFLLVAIVFCRLLDLEDTASELKKLPKLKVMGK